MKRALLILLAATFLFPLLVVAAFYGYENWTGNAAWSRAQAALRAAGEPLTLEALQPKPIPDSENMAAAPVFRQLFTFYNPGRAGVNGLRLPPPAPSPGPAQDSTLVALARRFQADFSGDAAEAGKVILAGLEPMEPMLDAIKLAAERPDAVWPLKHARGFVLPMPFLSPLKRTSEVLAARAAVSISAHQPADALSDLELITRLARDANQPPMLAGCLAEQAMLNYAVNIVRDGLAEGIWSDADLARIENELAAFQPLKSFADGVRGERAFVLAAPEEISAKAEPLFTIVDFRSTASAWITSNLCHIAWNLRPSGWLSRDRAAYATFTQDWLDLVIHNGFVRPWALAEWYTRLDLIRRNPMEFFRTPVTGLTLATFVPVARVSAYTQTQLDLARMACAIERCRRATNSLPEDLSSLAPRWIDRLPRDVVAGGSYFYRLEGQTAYLLYGKGWNARDDGGSSGSANPLLGPSTDKDWVWEGSAHWQQAAVR